MSDSADWLGLYRPDKYSSWEIVCQAPDYSDAWSMLLERCADRRGNGELLVSRTIPTEPVRRRPARRCL